MDEIRISLKKSIDDSYSIYLGTGIFKSQINAEIGRLSPSKITVITDSNLYKRYAGILESSIEFADKQIIQYPAGEENKNIGTLMQCFDAMLSFGMDRKSLVIAFGGGVTGDMAGLLAAVYMRGVNLIQVPTSVIAMVDSSIGGKTAIDVPLGKNLFGIFYQPKTVIIDVDFFEDASGTGVYQRAGGSDQTRDRKGFRLFRSDTEECETRTEPRPEADTFGNPSELPDQTKRGGS